MVAKLMEPWKVYRIERIKKGESVSQIKVVTANQNTIQTADGLTLEMAILKAVL